MCKTVRISSLECDEWFNWIQIYTCERENTHRAIVLCGNPKEAARLSSVWYDRIYGSSFANESNGIVIFSAKPVELFDSDCVFIVEDFCEENGESQHVVAPFSAPIGTND